MVLISFYRHRFFRVIADLTVRLTELAENASTSFWPLHLQDAINLKMVKINVDQHQIVHLMLDLQLDSQKLAHPTVQCTLLRPKTETEGSISFIFIMDGPHNQS